MWEATEPVGVRLVELVAPAPGATVLELACGPGDTGFLAAARLGPEGRLVSTDFAPEMVAAAARRARALGLTNVEHRVVDAQAIDLPDAAVDGVLCRFGIMLCPDPGAALAETARVLRPGGRVAIAVWADRRRNPWGTVVARALVQLELVERPDPRAPGPFALDDPALLLELLRGAGLSEPLLEEVAVSWRYASLDEFWHVSADLSRLLRSAVDTLAPGDLRRVRALVDEQLAPYVGPGGLDVPGVALLAACRRGTGGDR